MGKVMFTTSTVRFGFQSVPGYRLVRNFGDFTSIFDLGPAQRNCWLGCANGCLRGHVSGDVDVDAYVDVDVDVDIDPLLMLGAQKILGICCKAVLIAWDDSNREGEISRVFFFCWFGCPWFLLFGNIAHLGHR